MTSPAGHQDTAMREATECPEICPKEGWQVAPLKAIGPLSGAEPRAGEGWTGLRQTFYVCECWTRRRPGAEQKCRGTDVGPGPLPAAQSRGDGEGEHGGGSSLQ